MGVFNHDQWALILGGSSGFGLATAKRLSADGMSVCVVHRDLRGALSGIEKEFDRIRAHKNGFLALNVNALTADGRKKVFDSLFDQMGKNGRVRLFMHSIAQGNLKLLAPLQKGYVTDIEYGTLMMEEEDMAGTIYSMGTSLLSWVQDIHTRGGFSDDARVLGLTSEGSQIALRGYAAVSTAKAALEAVVRSIAVEFAPYGIRANILQPGITDTQALRWIPGSEKMKQVASARNPFKRLTQPEDVAQVVSLMCRDEAAWINGAVIRVDGGESIASL